MLYLNYLVNLFTMYTMCALIIFAIFTSKNTTIAVTTIYVLRANKWTVTFTI